MAIFDRNAIIDAFVCPVRAWGRGPDSYIPSKKLVEFCSFSRSEAIRLHFFEIWYDVRRLQISFGSHISLNCRVSGLVSFDMWFTGITHYHYAYCLEQIGPLHKNTQSRFPYEETIIYIFTLEVLMYQMYCSYHP